MKWLACLNQITFASDEISFWRAVPLICIRRLSSPPKHNHEVEVLGPGLYPEAIAQLRSLAGKFCDRRCVFFLLFPHTAAFITCFIMLKTRIVLHDLEIS